MRSLIALVLGLGLAACEGPMGQPGATGPAGPMGNPGSPAPDGSKIVSSIVCGGALDETNYGFLYQVDQFDNGNVFATGSVIGGYTMGTGTSLYAPSQPGSVNAPVIFTWDIYGAATGGWWEMTVDKLSFVVTIIYTDSEAASPAVWTTLPSECVTRSY